MGYADDPEPINWRAIRIGALALLAIIVIASLIYAANYYDSLPTPAQKAAQDAAANYDFLEEQHASYSELCAAAAAAKAAYADIQDTADYREMGRKAEVDCFLAEHSS